MTPFIARNAERQAWLAHSGYMRTRCRADGYLREVQADETSVKLWRIWRAARGDLHSPTTASGLTRVQPSEI